MTVSIQIAVAPTNFERFSGNSKPKFLRSKELKVLSFVKIGQKLWELQQMKVCNTLTARPVYIHTLPLRNIVEILKSQIPFSYFVREV